MINYCPNIYIKTGMILFWNIGEILRVLESFVVELVAFKTVQVNILAAYGNDKGLPRTV